jgi:hypothetical protein
LLVFGIGMVARIPCSSHILPRGFEADRQPPRFDCGWTSSAARESATARELPR